MFAVSLPQSRFSTSRQSDPAMIKEIVAAVTIPVMAKARIGHFVEAQILQSIGVDYIDESEVLTPADDEHHIVKHSFKASASCVRLCRWPQLSLLGPFRLRREGSWGSPSPNRRRCSYDSHQRRGCGARMESSGSDCWPLVVPAQRCFTAP